LRSRCGQHGSHSAPWSIFPSSAAHGIYRDGEIRCEANHGDYFPDEHYRHNDDIDHERSYQFKLPPLNHDTDEYRALRDRVDVLSEAKTLDFAVLEIVDFEILNRQTGGERMAIRLRRADPEYLLQGIAHFSFYLTGARKNFFNFEQVAIESGCRIYASNIRLLLRHTCDTGDGSSGSHITYFDGEDIFSVGMHYGTIHDEGDSITENLPLSDARGNYMISAGVLARGIEYISGEFPE